VIWYRRAVIAFSFLFVAIGVALLAVTVANSGGTMGYILGGLFIVLGVARATVERRRGLHRG
jgi:hypothetical protein